MLLHGIHTPPSYHQTAFPSSQDSGGASGPALLKSLVTPDVWASAKMDEVIEYLARNKHLQVPTMYSESLGD